MTGSGALPPLSEVIGVWLAALLTIAIFSFLYKDNPLYKLAEHLFVGVSAGYMMAVSFQNVIRPNLLDPLGRAWAAARAGEGMAWDWIYLIPLAMGIMLTLRIHPRLAWVSRWPLAFLVGISAGYNIVYTMESQILKQVDATVLDLWLLQNPEKMILNWIVLVGVVCGLVYFYFSIEHKGAVKVASRIGIYVLMISFGASFGYTVMGRVSLLIGRMLFFRNEWWPMVQATLGGGG